MENTLVLYYSPELIDEAVLQHIRITTGYTGKAEITYTHKRTLRKVSAEVVLTEPVIMATSKAATPIKDLPELEQYEALSIEPIGFDAEPIGFDDEPLGFEDLPVHEQEEASDFENAEVQAEALRKESREADSELEEPSLFEAIPHEEEDEDDIFKSGI